MTLESILYLAFGFLVAVFLALILVPVVWNRAVYLTERKVKGSLPSNAREVEAEKDTLRAEHAMTVRRLELAIGELREKASTHIAELHGKRDENNRLKSTFSLAKEDLESLEQAAKQMRGKIADLHENNTSLSKELETTTTKFEKIDTEHKELLSRHSVDTEELCRSRVDLIAKDGKIESLAATLGTLDLSEDAKATKVKTLSEEIAALEKQLDEEQKLSKKHEKSSLSLAKQLTTASTKIEASSQKNSGEIAGSRKNLEARIVELGEELMQEKTRSIELEAELARRALNLEITEANSADGSTSDEKVSKLQEFRQTGEIISAEIKALANKKPTTAEKERLRESIRKLGEKTSDLASLQ